MMEVTKVWWDGNKIMAEPVDPTTIYREPALQEPVSTEWQKGYLQGVAEQEEKYKWGIHSCGPTCQRYACVAIREAVEAEREACAKVCDDLYRAWVSTDNDDINPPDALDCKIAIRARSNT
jgi:hypothetical protein